jgi:hypothetical protein
MHAKFAICAATLGMLLRRAGETLQRAGGRVEIKLEVPLAVQ